MTPTLFGRWQTRTLLLATLGAIVTAIFAVAKSDETFFIVLAFVALFGLAWDAVYIAIQRLRWDRDWPTPFQVAAGVVEGVLVYALIEAAGLPGIDQGSVGIGLFVAHYGLTWLSVFLFTQGPMRVVVPRWRYDGGRVL
ncbi:MAG: hypothetical protein O6913_04140 [Chloroflexi bacterium]|nr:hypothetical protein [Chloroflexota bacterium]